MEEGELEWEKKIESLFQQAPHLRSLIEKPVYCSDAPWAGEVYSYFLKNTQGSTGEDFYRVVYKQGSPTSLMTIGSGELSGLKTTTVVERGRIADVAGLERVDIPAEINWLPMLLMMGIFGAVQRHVGYISNVCADIRNRQIVGDHAKLERISEVILDCFESIPEMDQNMMHLNLSRAVSNTDDCHELLIVMREELNKESQDNPRPPRTFDKWTPQPDNSSFNPVEFMRRMMRHNVFAAYERFVAGKICQIVLSRNYSPSNIKRSKDAAIRVKDTIRKIFEGRIKAHEEGVKEYGRLIFQLRNGYEIGGNWTISELEECRSSQELTIINIEKKLCELLDAKLESFDFLSRLSSRDEINVYLTKNVIVISEEKASAQPGQQEPVETDGSQVPAGMTPGS
ncbi:hypothetical protein GLE_5493 [Lysobacter enzymogenes]|uniref:Uncharacterized protein n=1 Tax=Lysobacter enzymogenes TaxID=69 RepID=A0A0S2DQJ2_LYSEN|nr:hypothetical protein [Lysobacter enzymogenes]ALN60834.1 hypothetical protein GLE_5493 [Lysobacter enzymogenes]QCW24401.1 hypothetical protein FE772_00680 [Lysobacter enzymogenes]